MTKLILQEAKVTRSKNEANQLVIIRSIKLQITLTDIDAHRNYVANLTHFYKPAILHLPIKQKLGLLLSSAEQLTKDHC